jgi:hypothetical protein
VKLRDLAFLTGGMLWGIGIVVAITDFKGPYPIFIAVFIGAFTLIVVNDYIEEFTRPYVLGVKAYAEQEAASAGGVTTDKLTIELPSLEPTSQTVVCHFQRGRFLRLVRRRPRLVK